MTFGSQKSNPVFRIDFDCRGPMDPRGVHDLIGHLIEGLPVAPGSVQVSPEGNGAITYGEDDELTLTELEATVLWLRDQPQVTDVRWQAVVDI